MTSLKDQRILVCISGGIAAYKSAHLVRLLTQAGAQVQVAMTQAAQAFITPLTLQALSKSAVHTSLLDADAEAGMGHIELARWAQAIVMAPATADLIARLAHGHADDLVSTLYLASQAPVWIAPAMNQAMWAHPATQTNLQILRTHQVHILGPASGEQACGDLGMGRMLEPEQIVAALQADLEVPKPQGPKVVITAGPTREPIDPVRYISNHSSGKMGYALAAAAQALGCQVTLVSGPTQLACPLGVTRVDVESAEQMLAACLSRVAHTDVFIAAAAVADYRLAEVAVHKLKKDKNYQGLTLNLVENPDIVATIAQHAQRPALVVGFAAETQEVQAYALAKLQRKGLDMMIANDVSNPAIGFDSDQNAVTLITKDRQQAFEIQSKKELAHQLMIEILQAYAHQ